ncbi:hypothetical protein HDU93_004547, partial [Gonapodya sp. JEL0774]
RYLPFRGHVGFDTIAAEDDLFDPKFPVLKPDEDQNLGHTGGHNDDNDYDNSGDNHPPASRKRAEPAHIAPDIVDVVQKYL